MIIKKVLGIRESGHALVRLYPRMKAGRNFSAVMSAFDFGLAAVSAKQKDALSTIFLGGFSMYFAKQAKDLHEMTKIIEPRVNQIFERAKKIKFKK